MVNVRKHYPDFLNTWMFVDFETNILPGKPPISKQIMGRELIVWRDRRGQVSVMDAHCPHLGAHLGKPGKVVDNCVRCPFHHFTFDVHGRRTDAKGRSAYVYDTRLVSGMIFAWFHEAYAAPTWDLPDFTCMNGRPMGVLSHYPMRHTANTVIDYLENSLDPRHFTIVHRFQRAELTDAKPDGPELTHTMRAVIVPGGPEATIDFRFIGPCIGIADATFSMAGRTFRQRHLHNAVLHNARANTLFNIKLLAEEDILRFRSFRPQAPKSWADYLFGLVVAGTTPLIDRQDDPIWENRIHLENPDLSRAERGVAVMHRWLERFYPESHLAKEKPKRRLRAHDAAE
jgi:cholesterol 7-desaturase